MTKAHADLKENYALAAIYISQLEEEKSELLEALKGFVSIYGDNKNAKVVDDALRAIQKAEGKA